MQGIFYFIYNDEVPYLDGRIRAEEFDQTLCDVWYNPTDVYTELAKLGKDILPVLPSMLGAKEVDTYHYDKKRQWVQKSAVNQYGTWWIKINGDLNRRRRFNLPHVENDLRVYDPLKGAIITDKSIAIDPGDGIILLIANDQQIASLAKKVEQRRLAAELEQLNVTYDQLCKAGVIEPDTHLESMFQSAKDPQHAVQYAQSILEKARLSGHAYFQTQVSLQAIANELGIINQTMLRPQMIQIFENQSNAKVQSMIQSIRTLGTTYFSYHADWQIGKVVSVDHLNELLAQAVVLKSKAKSIIK